jgi:hypothetical protein
MPTFLAAPHVRHAAGRLRARGRSPAAEPAAGRCRRHGPRARLHSRSPGGWRDVSTLRRSRLRRSRDWPTLLAAAHDALRAAGCAEAFHSCTSKTSRHSPSTRLPDIGQTVQTPSRSSTAHAYASCVWSNSSRRTPFRHHRSEGRRLSSVVGAAVRVLRKGSPHRRSQLSRRLSRLAI